MAVPIPSGRRMGAGMPRVSDASRTSLNKHAIAFVDTLLRTPTGKLQKHLIRGHTPVST
jgi:hypothetical protein